MGKTKNLFDRVWDLHKVAELESGQDQLFIGLHLLHEVTSPQAFGMIDRRGLSVLYPERTFASVDHIVPTDSRKRPFQDHLAEEMIRALEENTRRHGITFFGLESQSQGIVHIIAPELGLTQPGMTIACGDSHTSTHGAFGAVAFGIGTSQIRDILASQTMALSRPKVRLINAEGTLGPGVYAKDLILRIIADLGVNGGIGYAYEYNGEAVRSLSMEARMTLCNMSIEGGARAGYVNPDLTTFSYLKGRRYAPEGSAFEDAVKFWSSIASPPDAAYDDTYCLDAKTIKPMVTWGTNPGQGIGVDERLPMLRDIKDDQERRSVRSALDHMGFTEGDLMLGKPVDVVFIGSCTNGRISDFREAARIVKGRRVAHGLRALAVPGSRQVAMQAQREGLDAVFREAGFQWREPGCSMCLAMNPDKLFGRELCASTSNRNFVGRQGSPTGRTLLMSPSMAAAAAVRGKITDVRDMEVL